MQYKNYILSLFIGILFFGMAHSIYADVVINEIAWMGTTTSTNDEWMELYNNGSSSVALDGWTLNAADGSPKINLTGNISAGGYMLLERTDDTTVPGVTAGVIYSGALGNSGENLLLKNNTEQIIDTVDMSSGWTAGNSTTKETMQRSGSGWITGTPTPGMINVTTGSTTPSSTETTQTDSSTSDTSDNDTETVIKVEADPVYVSKMVTPDIFIQQVPMNFSSEVKKDGKLNDIVGRFEWSMGDGGSFVFHHSTPFTYTYTEPGTYVVLLRYYSNDFKESPDTIHKKTITVIPAHVGLVINHETGTITLTNQSTDDLNLQKWQLQSGNESFTFPIDTIIPKDTSVSIPFSVHKFSNFSLTPTLLTPTGFVASAKQQTYHVVSSKTPEITNIAEASSDTENLFQSPAPDEKVTVPVKENFQSLWWILLFCVLLAGTTVAFHFIARKIETVEETKAL